MTYRTFHTVIAGGGTGGHLFPGIAIARALKKRQPQGRILFIGSGRPIEISVLKRERLSFAKIPVEGLKARDRKSQIKALLLVPLAMTRAAWLLIRHQAGLVIGMGGYSAGPVVLAGRILGRKVMLHEQNVLPGITTRLTAPLAHKVCVSFGETRLKKSPEHILVTGNPVRSEIQDMARTRNQTPPVPGNNRRTLLILGGSQGARAINRCLIKAAPKLAEIAGLYLIHQTGETDHEMVAGTYAGAGVAAMAKPFFNHMAPLYRKADLILCRAGATTVAEITAMGKPSVLIPFPHAADDHQRKNAEVLVKNNAARMVLEKDLTPGYLVEEIGRLFQSDNILEQLGENARKMNRPGAADRIAKLGCELVWGSSCI